MKLLIIEDDAQIIEAISLAFEIRWPDTTIIYTDKGQKGIELVEIEKPDVVIIDIGLTDISGFDVLKKVRAFSSVPIMIITARSDEADIVKGLEWGADEYVTKPFRQLELLSRIKAIIRRQKLSEQAQISCGNMQYNPSSREIRYAGQNIKLTPTESCIIQILMQNEGHYVSYSALSECVWGSNFDFSIPNIKVHIRRLRQKMEVNANRPKLILNRPSVGYMLVKQEQSHSK